MEIAVVALQNSTGYSQASRRGDEGVAVVALQNSTGYSYESASFYAY